MKVQDRDRLLFRAIAENDLNTVKKLAPRPDSSSAHDVDFTKLLSMAEKLQRIEIAHYLLDKIPSILVQNTYHYDRLLIVLSTRHPRLVKEYIEYTRSGDGIYHDVPIWLCQIQLTKGIIHESQALSSEERKWWLQASIGISPDPVTEIFVEEWTDKVFPFLLNTEIQRDIYPRGGLFPLMLLSGMIPWSWKFHQDLHSLDSLTLDVVLRAARLPDSKLIPTLHSYLISKKEKPTVGNVVVYLKYIQQIPMDIRFDSVSLGSEMMALFF